jgi:hypothetical protein
MNRDEIIELYFIAPIANVPSIMQHGILSHKLAQQIAHDSVAMQEIQERRRNKQIPGARRLHEYANLYFDAHNPMLSKTREQNDRLCLLRVDVKVLNLPGVIIADQNASSKWVRFYSIEDGLRAINRDRVYAVSWKHPNDLIDEWQHKSEKCAEVLVPDRVETKFIVGAYVASDAALSRFRQLNIELPVCIRNDIFFY